MVEALYQIAIQPQTNPRGIAKDALPLAKELLEEKEREKREFEASREARLNACDCWMLGSETAAHCERCSKEREQALKERGSI